MKFDHLITSSPHIKQSEGTGSVMLDVIIALIPAGLGAVLFFGFSVLSVIATSVVSCILAEYVWCRLMKKPSSTGDLSAIVTGLLLAYSLPPSTPLWIVIIGACFSIIVAKQLFGGLGHNFMNPALCGRAFMLASWPAIMTEWTAPSLFGSDVVTSATPLAALNAGNLADLPPLSAMIFGNIGGCIGETSGILILLGGLYLIIRKVISWRIPVFYMLTSFIIGFAFAGGSMGENLLVGLMHIVTGGLLLGAVFMATDYTTSPVTPTGHIIMGIGCGLLTSLIRMGGGYAEGVTYAILVMNAVTPLIDKYVKPHTFGHFKEKKEAEANG